MSVMPAPLVAAPARAPLPYGLFSTFTFRPAAGGVRWSGAGIEYETIGCGPLRGIGFTVDFCADPDTVDGLPRSFERGAQGIADGTPFSLIAGHFCSPVGNSATVARGLAEARLLVAEERAVEYALTSGVLGNRPNLRGATPLTTGPVPFDVGIGLLEEWLGFEYGSQGVIHVPRAVAGSSLKASGQTLRTHLGTPVAAGAGYDGASPDGTPATGAARWIYATPAITGYRGDITTTDLFDRRANDQVAYAERDYLLTFEDCGVAAVQVALSDKPDLPITLPARPTSPSLII